MLPKGTTNIWHHQRLARFLSIYSAYILGLQKKPNTTHPKKTPTQVQKENKKKSIHTKNPKKPPTNQNKQTKRTAQNPCSLKGKPKTNLNLAFWRQIHQWYINYSEGIIYQCHHIILLKLSILYKLLENKSQSDLNTLINIVKAALTLKLFLPQKQL